MGIGLYVYTRWSKYSLTMIVKRTGTLFSRTGYTIALSLLVFFVITFGAVFYYILAPMSRQSADDLAALILFSAQTWTELPPDTRKDFTEELYANHGLTLLTKTPLLKRHPLETPYMHFLEEALTKRTGMTISIKTRPHDELRLWVDVPIGDHTFRFGFPHSRIGVQPSIVIIWGILGGIIVSILTSLFLVRRLTVPLQRLYVGTRAFTGGNKLEPIPESGPHELANLTHSFNEMTRQINELMENRTTLMAGISHDLRTPITRIQLAMAMLNETAEPKLVAGVLKDLDEMTELIARTMEIAKGLDNRNEETQEIDLSELIDRIVSQYQSEDVNRIIWKPHKTCLQHLNAIALRRVVTNLLENALYYACNDAEDKITILYECNPDVSVIKILDRGPGIPLDQQETVFQPFHRLEVSRSRATGGSGLGLAIVKQLCEANGWQIQLLSRQGGGTIARLEINGTSLPNEQN